MAKALSNEDSRSRLSHRLELLVPAGKRRLPGRALVRSYPHS